jgi:hypothetical protein
MTLHLGDLLREPRKRYILMNCVRAVRERNISSAADVRLYKEIYLS